MAVAESIDKQHECGRGLPTARIVEAVAGNGDCSMTSLVLGIVVAGGFQGEQPDYSWKFVQWAQFGVFYEKIISTRFVTLIGGSLAFPIASSDCSATASDGSYIACDSTNKPKPLIGFTYAIGPAF